MSIDSLHQTHPEMNGGSYAKASIPEWAMAHAKMKHYVIQENLENAGFTRFDLRDVMVGYVRGKGVGRRASLEIGYAANPDITGIKTRLRNAGPHKMRALHELMKAEGEGAYKTVNMDVQRVPLFYTFERLLQLFFPDYVAIPIPHHIRNWVPAEGTYWAHWWKER